MDLPGLLTDDGTPRRHPLRWIPAVLILAFAVLLGLLTVQLVRLKEQRDRAQAKVEELLKETQRPAPAVGSSLSAAEFPAFLRRLEDLEARLARMETLRGAEPAPAMTSAPPSPLPESPPPTARPVGSEAMVYLHVSAGFAGRGLWPESLRALGEALRLDPPGTWRLKPRGLFSPEAFERLLAELERRVRDDPMDTEARTLLAYLYFHEKGTEAARALLLQILAVSPDHVPAKRLLEEMER